MFSPVTKPVIRTGFLQVLRHPNPVSWGDHPRDRQLKTLQKELIPKKYGAAWPEFYWMDGYKHCVGEIIPEYSKNWLFYGANISNAPRVKKHHSFPKPAFFSLAAYFYPSDRTFAKRSALAGLY